MEGFTGSAFFSSTFLAVAGAVFEGSDGLLTGFAGSAGFEEVGLAASAGFAEVGLGSAGLAEAVGLGSAGLGSSFELSLTSGALESGFF